MIDSYRELSDIRSKYKITEDIKKIPDGEKPKTIKPWFFAHIVKQKGFYNPKTKQYTKFKTSMDYLQEAINSYKLRNQKRMKDGFLPFCDVVNDAHCRFDFIDHKTIGDIWDAAAALKARYEYIYQTEDDAGAARRQVSEAKSEFYEYMDGLDLNKSTMVSLLQSVESQKTEKFMSTLFYGLFGTANPSLYNCIRDSSEPIESIVPDPDGDIEIYGYRYTMIVA